MNISNKFLLKIKKKINIFLLIYFFCTFFVLVFIVLNTVYSSKYKTIKQNFLNVISKEGRFEYLYLPKILFYSIKGFFISVDKLSINMNFQNLLRLEEIRKEALKNGQLPKRDLLPKVKVTLSFKDKNINGKARLKGDRTIHFKDPDRTSYRVYLKDDYLYGLKKFSIQKPKVRNYIYEWLYQEISGELGLIKLEYKFVNLIFNGKNRGLFVIEQGFDQNLIEKNKRRSGPIFGLDEEINDSSENPVFDIYSIKKWKNEKNINILQSSSLKLKKFLDGDIPPENVMDIEKWATLFAITDFTRTYHGLLLKSVKFYYNTVSGLFEPIPFDGHRFQSNYHRFASDYDKEILIDKLINKNQKVKDDIYWIRNFFFNKKNELNNRFYNLYLQKLNYVSSKNFLDNFLKKNINTINKINSLIYSDHFFNHNEFYKFGLYYFSLTDFWFHANNIREKINQSPKLLLIREGNNLELKKYGKFYTLLTLTELICKTSVVKKKLLINRFVDIKFEAPEDCNAVKITNNINNSNLSLAINQANSYFKKNIKNIDKKNFLDVFYIENNILFLKEKETVIKRDLYIPPNYEVSLLPGQILKLINNSSIISESPWRVEGEVNKKVYIGGIKENRGGAVFINANKKKSYFKNINISYLGNFLQFTNDTERNYITTDNKHITGAITLYNGDYIINNVKFKNISFEDTLNIISSKFQIDNCIFMESGNDAIDTDFSSGEIKNTKFYDVGNDALDLSQSKVKIINIFAQNISDKVVSAGENSVVFINNLHSVNSKYGIASKDGAIVNASNIRINMAKFHLASYNKKKSYSQGNLRVEKYNTDDEKTNLFKDNKSMLKIVQ